MTYIPFIFLLISVLFIPLTTHAEPVGTTTEPADSAYEVQTVSNVLFLPGIKGSRLYENDEKLWEPSGKEDIEALFLKEDGRSMHADVYAKTGDILSRSFGHEFYTSFFDDLDAYEENDVFGDQWTWEAAAYDWRLFLTDIVTLGAREEDRVFYNRTSDMPYIEKLLRELALGSETGKVTIVAHSNGGLVAKALVEKLGVHAAELIDHVVFVGVPHAGAPRALAAALFGYGEALPFDSCAEWPVARLLCTILVDRPTARLFAEFSPMTYHLLPSEAYFSATRDDGFPVLGWYGLTLFPKESERYGVAIDSSAELYDYALAVEGGRTKPEDDDMNKPNILSPSLIAYARDMHASLDAWTPPLGITIHNIVGWGKDTLSGIQFYEKPGPFGLFGGKETLYRPAFIEDGDGIVPTKSALIHEGDTYQVDLSEKEAGHADLLELPEVRTHIHDILTSNTYTVAPMSLSSGPTDRRRIMFFIHEDAIFGLYDSQGRYTGKKNEVVSSEIPDVEYGELGEMAYLLAPAGHAYELVIQGTDYGTFTFEMLERVRNNVATTSSIVNVPVTPSSTATITIPEVTGDISDLSLDYDGNGTTDLSIAPQLGTPVMVEEGLVPEIPEPEPDPVAPAPEQEPERRSSNRREVEEEPLSFDEQAATTSLQTIAPDEPELVLVQEEVETIIPSSSPLLRRQTASVHDATEKIPRKFLFLITIPFLLLLLFVATKLRTDNEPEDIENKRREGLGEEIAEHEEEDNER